MNLRIAFLIASAACALALACGHEAGSPRALPAPATIAVVTVAPNVSDPAASAAIAADRASPSRAAEPHGEACIEVDDDLGGTHISLEGRIVVDDEFEHPARGKTHPYVLRLDAPRCAVGIDDAQVREVALASSEGIELKPLVGRRVRVSGDPFMAHTAWHARPIVLMATTVTRVP